MKILTGINIWLILILIQLCWHGVFCSRGDNDVHFRRCLKSCELQECVGKEYRGQKLYLKFLGWDCEGQCQYNCMWKTVKFFQKHDQDIPQFYGKWPFVRIFGIQEPASVVASLLNLLVHVFGILQLRKHKSVNIPGTDLYWLWHLFAFVCINGWIWSTVFHTRDTPTTELMDYFSAFSVVTFSLLCAFVRVYETAQCPQVLGTSFLIITFFIYHVYYLALVKFDYGYNMKVNIVTGLSNASLWLLWCWKNRATHLHVWKCATFTLLAVLSIALEILDFPPILWIFDAHGIWHFSTAFITPLWYSFLIDDYNHLQNEASKHKIP